MATKESQKQWRDRARTGQIRHCPLCGKRLRQESKTICQACWLKTPEGREYNRQKVNRHRSRIPLARLGSKKPTLQSTDQCC